MAGGIIRYNEAPITVTFEELDGSPEEGYDDKGLYARRTLLCAWPERHTLARQLKGGYQTVGNSTMYTLPASYPEYPLARVQDIEIEGEGQPEVSSPGRRYEKAKLTVYYAVASIEEETLAEESIEPAAEFLTLPTKNFFWGTGAGAIALQDTEAPGMLIQMFDWVYTIKYQNRPPAWFGSIEGHVNSNPVQSVSLGRTFAAETLLAGKPSLNRTVTTYGDRAWTCTLRFTHRNIPWNLFPRVDNATGSGISWEPITNGQIPLRVYPTADFRDIVR